MTVTMTGPLFDGRATDMITEMARHIQGSVADEAFVKWETNMEHAIRHSGPIYQSFAQRFERDGDSVLNDGWGQTNRLPYGPWLEGVGSRNSPVTRFPGYFSLRRDFEATNAEVSDLAEPFVDEYVDRINNE